MSFKCTAVPQHLVAACTPIVLAPSNNPYAIMKEVYKPGDHDNHRS